MKTRSFLESNSNIASIVKARRNINSSEPDGVTYSQLNNESLLIGLANSTIISSANEINNQTIFPHVLPEKKVIIKTLWTHEDKNMFFTALKILGKNFNEISRFIKNRCNRSNPKNSGKTKEQVRFFYNRTWNNIKPYLKFPIELVQSVQEVYALVNYSVFRTRVKKKLNPKLGEKLNEMVMNGSTVIKCNGKRITLRTPVCPALKKMNNIKVHDRDREYTVPDDVLIELVPRNHVTLWRVQQLEQNPRMRLKVALNRPLSDIILFLGGKLKSNSQIIRESLSMPTVEPPRLHIRLSDDCRLQHDEIVLQEVFKPRFDNITLKSYCDNVLKAQSEAHKVEVGDAKQSTSTANVGEDPEEGCLRLDLTEMKRKLSVGVGTEEARDMKVLSLYIGLGCPTTIKFLYEYLHPSDVDSAQSSVSNGLRRLLHLGKHDYLEYENNKDKKSQLESELEDLEKKVAAAKQQLTKLNNINNGTGSSSRHNVDSDRNSPGNGETKNETAVSNQSGTVFKRQEDAIRQLLEELPRKTVSHVSVIQTHQQAPQQDPSHSQHFPPPSLNVKQGSIASVNQFNRARRHPRGHQQKQQQQQHSAGQLLQQPGLFTLRMPLDANQSHVPQSQHHQHLVFPSMDSLSSDLFLSQLSSQPPSASATASSSLYPQMHLNHDDRQVPSLDQCDNTNDSLRSFLNDMNDFQRSVDDSHNIEFQNFYQNNSFFNLMNESLPGTDGTKQPPQCDDSNSGSFTNLLNSYVKSEKS